MREFIITEDQAEKICKLFGKNVSELSDWQIGELLDEVIDKLEESEVRYEEKV